MHRAKWFLVLLFGLPLAAVLLLQALPRGGASGSDPARERVEAIAWSANRLAALQNRDGGWPRGEKGPSESSSFGASGRSLLWAWNVTRSERHFRSARRAGNSLLRRLPREPRLALAINGVFLAELGRVTGDSRYTIGARGVWAARRAAHRWRTGADAARAFRDAACPDDWTEAGWRNYQLWRAWDEVELARAAGEEGFAREMSLALLRGFDFHPGEPFWSLAASRTVEILSSFPGNPFRPRAEALLRFLLEGQVAPGLVGPDAPEGPFVYAMDNAAFLRGLLAARDPELAELARQGSAFFVDRQLRFGTGGWQDVLALGPGPTLASERAEGVREYPGVSAEVLTAIARAERPSLGRI